MTLAASTGSANVGYPLTFTATVTPVTTGNAQAPAGNVEFFDGATQIGSVALLTASSPYTAAFTTSSLAAGSHNISATFVDTDGNFGGNSSAVSVEAVNLIVPTINWTPTPTEFAYGTPLGSAQLTATVTDPITSNPVNGTIAFNFASGAVLPAGQPNLILTFTPADPTTYSNNSAQFTIIVDPASGHGDGVESERDVRRRGSHHHSDLRRLPERRYLRRTDHPANLHHCLHYDERSGELTLHQLLGRRGSQLQLHYVSGSVTVTPATQTVRWARRLLPALPTTASSRSPPLPAPDLRLRTVPRVRARTPARPTR